ncbi:MAG TPA: hypothetical protein VH482_30085 [Thermomicrobiales bacterium]
MTDQPPPRRNPYVGPRAFETGEHFYGRDREVRDLTNLLIARRIVLLYSPSGAGKTSLIQAGLIPRLHAKGFAVLPTIRVNLPLLDAAAPAGSNRYLLSALRSLEGEPEDETPEAERSYPSSLKTYLDDRPRPGDNHSLECLIFDQFEEILTTDPTDHDGIGTFIGQAGEALESDQRWALFSMREDHVGALEPYLSLLPTRLKTTFRLDLLTRELACEAVQRPARDEGVDFTDEAAGKLIADLSRVLVQRADGTTEPAEGRYVEPVQLQVVCSLLWKHLAPGQNRIEPADVAALGDVDTVLGAYYADGVAAVARDTGVDEHEIRTWFNDRLITEQGIRTQVLWTPKETAGLDDRALQPLVNTHLVRAERRRGLIWYELAHDRLVEPVRKSNAAWFKQAIAFRAEDVFRSLPAADQTLAPIVLTRLVRLDDGPSSDPAGRRDTAVPVERSALVPAGDDAARVDDLVARLATGGVLTTRDDTVELAGDAILRDWPRFRRWLETDRSALLSRQEVGQAAREWDRNGRDDAHLLHRGAGLKGLEDLAARGRLPVNDLERAYLDASGAREEREHAEREAERETHRQRELEAAQKLAAEQSRAASRLRRFLVAAAVLAVIALLATGIALWQRSDAVDARDQANVAREQTEQAARILRIEALAAQAPREYRREHGGQAALLAREAYLLNQENGDPSFSAVDDALRSTINQPYFSTLLPNQRDWVGSLAFSPNGNILASGGANSEVWVWNLDATANGPARLTGHKGWVSSVAFSPDGTVLASGSADGTVRLWDTANLSAAPRVLAVPAGTAPAGGVRALAFGPDGTTLLTGGCATASTDVKSCGPGLIRMWDLRTGSPQREWQTAEAEVRALAISPDGKTVATGGCVDPDPTTDYCRPGETAISVWDLTHPDASPILLHGHTGSINALAFSPLGRTLASGSDDTTIRIWKVGNWNADPQVLQGHDEAVRTVAFGRDGALLASGGQDETVRLWDLTGVNPPAIIGGSEEWVRAVAFSTDGQTLASASAGGTIRLTYLGDPNAGNTAPSILRGHVNTGVVQDWVLGLAFSPDGQYLASASEDHTAILWPIRQPNRDKVVLPRQSSHVTAVAFSPDGKVLATSGCGQLTGDTCVLGEIRLWSVPWGVQIGNPLQGHNNEITSIAFDPVTGLLASGGYDGRIFLWDITNPGAPPMCLIEHPNAGVRSLAFSPDGKTLASADGDFKVRLLDVPNALGARNSCGSARIVLAGHTDKVAAVAFSPDGRTLASGSWDGTVRLWDLTQSDPSSTVLVGHEDQVKSVAFSPDGTLLASGSNDQTVRLWDLRHLDHEPAIIGGSEEWVRALVFSPDGSILASASADGTVRLSVARDADLADQVCARVGRNLSQAEWENFVGPTIPYERTCPDLPPGEGAS